MNIDELKNTWNADDSFEEAPQISIEQKNKINLPLEKVRKNMRKEFWYTLITFIIAFFAVLSCKTFKLQFYLSVLIVSMAFVIGFFFSKFFKLYKEISNTEMSTYDSLKDLLQQFYLNKQYYISFYLSFVPFLVCEMIIVIEFIPHSKPLSELKTAVLLIGSVVIGLSALFLMGKYWFHRFYGKYIEQIENLVTEFKK